MKTLKNSSITCDIHNNNKAKFLNYNQEGIVQYECSQCVSRKSKELRVLVNLQEIFSEGNNLIFNWPPLQDDKLYLDLESVFEGQKKTEIKVKEVEELFSNFEKQVNSQIKATKASIIDNLIENNDNLVKEVYMKIANKNELMSVIGEDKKGLEDLLKGALENSQKNTEIISESLNNYLNTINIQYTCIQDLQIEVVKSLQNMQQLYKFNLSIDFKEIELKANDFLIQANKKLQDTVDICSKYQWNTFEEIFNGTFMHFPEGTPKEDIVFFRGLDIPPNMNQDHFIRQFKSNSKEGWHIWFIKNSSNTQIFHDNTLNSYLGSPNSKQISDNCAIHKKAKDLYKFIVEEGIPLLKKYQFQKYFQEVAK